MGMVYQTKTLLFLRSDETVWRPDFGGVPPSLEAFRTNQIGTWSDTAGALAVGTRLRAERATVVRYGGTVGRPVRIQARVLDGQLTGQLADLMAVSGSDYSRELGVGVPLVLPDVLEESK
jgi:hypothetical protein